MRLESVESCLRIILGLVLFISISGCNRAEVRIPGASTGFPETFSGYSARIHYPETITVEVPNDLRVNFYGVKVAGTNWEGCKTDSFFGDQARYVIRDRVIKELSESKLFGGISDAVETKPHDLRLLIEMHAFCSQVKGFIIARVAGIVALKFSVVRDDQVLFSKKIEKVVTDADPEYSGSQVTFIEQAMRRTMADSLREILKGLMADMELELQTKLKAA